MPYNRSFIDQASSVKMAGYWPRSLFTFLWTSNSSRSIKTQKGNSANIQPSWPRAWSIIYTYKLLGKPHAKIFLGGGVKEESGHHLPLTPRQSWVPSVWRSPLGSRLNIHSLQYVVRLRRPQVHKSLAIISHPLYMSLTSLQPTCWAIPQQANLRHFQRAKDKLFRPFLADGVSIL